MGSNPERTTEFRLPNVTAMSVLNTDLWIALAIFLMLCVGFFIIGGGPVTNDEMSYMYLAWFDQTWLTHLNRYVHVYFLKFFMWLVDDPYKGAQLAWAFIVATCSSMIYLGARSLTARYSYWPGIIALLFFLGQSSVFRYVGVTYADYTLMLWVTAATFVLIHRLSAPSEARYLHALLLGMLFVLAVKSKESGIILALPLIALAFTNKGFDLKIALSQWKWSLFGAVSILAGLVVLDAIFLGDMFFSINPDNLANTALHYIRSWERTRGNWLSYLFLSELSFPFILYFLAALPVIQRGNIELRFVYFMPLVLVLFLNTVMTVGAWNVIPRYFVPVLPAMTILAATYFYNAKQDWPGIRVLLPRYALVAGLFMAAACGLIAWKLMSSGSLIQFFGWTPYTFALNIYYPLVILTLAALYFFISNQESLLFRRVIYALTIASLLPMYMAMPNNLTFSNRIYVVRIYPLDVFSKHMEVNEKTRIMLTHALWKKNKMMEGSSSLMRLYFMTDIPDKNMLKSTEWDNEWGPDYVIATEADLVTWQEQGEHIYKTIIHEPDHKVVLLCAPGKCKKNV
jgi:hypothetical protein